MKTMQPDNGSGRSAAFQTALADYARGAAQAPEGVDIGRLGVYRRLLLNNLKSFIDLCFSASGGFAEAGLWHDLQRRFLLEARPQSPFFNDIPKQFLDYVRSRPENERPSENILHMMAFETDLLHAETAQRAQARGEAELLGGPVREVALLFACLRERRQEPLISAAISAAREAAAHEGST